MSNHLRVSPKALLLCVLFSLLAPGASAQSSAQTAPEPTIKVDVSVVNLPVSVRDSKGALISNLEKSDFEVREDGKLQDILYFSRDTTLPLTLGIMVDSSPSQARLIEQERSAAGQFLEEVLGKRDAAFLINFDSDVTLLQDVTNSVPMLRKALGTIRAQQPVSAGSSGSGPFPSSPFPVPSGVDLPVAGGTHLYDAVYLASDQVLRDEAGRKAIILITDGQDQGSQLSRDTATEMAQRNDVIIYGILFVDRSFYGFGGYSGESVLRKMADETGGRTFRANSSKELSDAFQQISEELRTQYNLGYSSTNTKHDGTFRRLELKVRGKDLRVQARKGYYAPQDNSNAAAR